MRTDGGQIFNQRVRGISQEEVRAALRRTRGSVQMTALFAMKMCSGLHDQVV